MASRKVLYGTGAVAAGGIGYYFYQAGGDAKVAERKFESDVTKLSSDAKSKLPGKEKEVEQDTKLSAQKLGSKVDNALDDVETRASKFKRDAERQAEQAKKDTGASLNKAVDKFDNTVTEGVSKTKGGISSWFGGGK